MRRQRRNGDNGYGDRKKIERLLGLFLGNADRKRRERMSMRYVRTILIRMIVCSRPKSEIWRMIEGESFLKSEDERVVISLISVKKNIYLAAMSTAPGSRRSLCGLRSEWK